MVWASRSDSKSALLMLDPSIGLPLVLPPLAMGGLGDCSGKLRLAAIAVCHLAGVADELAGGVFPRIGGCTGGGGGREAGPARPSRRPPNPRAGHRPGCRR